ncbi:MAG: class C sortase [Oscillospiraceae bacterium]|nr:class C sortase [Oscillospiraceae bacterium]
MIMLLGAGFLLYPMIANEWNKTVQSRAVLQYLDEVSSVDWSEAEAAVANAKAYNRELAQTGINWHPDPLKLSSYDELLNVTGSGMMGYIKIDKLDLMLPIYHGTSESVLSASIGHLEQTSLPVGAASFDPALEMPIAPDGSHCALSGHRGLPSARLFTDLDQLVEGDIFEVSILNETYAYEVDLISIVEPQDVSTIAIEPGKDYCTLITCTPYTINTHRLLVRGSRVGTDVMGKYKYRIQSNAILIRPVVVAPFLAAPVLLILFAVVMLAPVKRRSRYD